MQNCVVVCVIVAGVEHLGSQGCKGREYSKQCERAEGKLSQRPFGESAQAEASGAMTGASSTGRAVFDGSLDWSQHGCGGVMSCASVLIRAGLLIEAEVEVEAEKSQGDWGRQGWASASGAGTIVMGIAMSRRRARGQPWRITCGADDARWVCRRRRKKSQYVKTEELRAEEEGEEEEAGRRLCAVRNIPEGASATALFQPQGGVQGVWRWQTSTGASWRTRGERRGRRA